MQKTLKKSISILLSIMMIVGVFTIVPLSASAAVGDYVAEEDYLTFTAVENNSSVTLKVASCDYLQYNKNNSGWEVYSVGSLIALENAGDSVRFRGNNTKFNYRNHVSIGGIVACSGNVMSLRLDANGMVQGLSDSCFSNMFSGCTGLTAAPELPETTLASNCYYNMFADCGNLITAPELPATALAPYCYSYMFYGCGRLTTAPELWATSLASGCYENMFSGCEKLTTAPELPATSLEPYCYRFMFYRCKSLTTAPELPATELVSNCYTSMFNGCSSIKLSETQTEEYRFPYSVPSGGNGTTASSSTLISMFEGTGGTFTGTPEINKIYYRPAKKYTVTWKNDDGTTIDTTSVYEGDAPTHADPTKAEDEKYTYTFAGWSPEITAVTGDVTYTAQYTATFKGITSNELYKGLVIDAGTPIRFIMQRNNRGWLYIDLTVYLDGTLVKELYTSYVSETEPDRYYTTTKKCIVDSYESVLGNRSLHVLYLKSLYTVTWKDEDGTVLKTEDVAKGDTPSYGATPTKAEDENYTYTFAGWTPEVSAVTGDITYKATYTATPKLFTGHSVTLGGDIGVNFFLNPAVLDAYSGTKTVKFTVDGKETTVDVPATADDKGYMVTCNVVAAQMAHQISAVVYVGDTALDETDSYSVQEYAEAVYAEPGKYLRAEDAEKAPALQALAEAMLHYGAEAQTVFADALTEKPDRADKNVGVPDYSGVTADAVAAKINGTASDLNEVATQLDAKYFTNSLFYLQNNTLRVYFTPVKYGQAMPNAEAYTGNQSGYYYYKDHADIPAAELDDQQDFAVGDVSFKYSPLNYVVNVLNSNMIDEQQNLAKALFLYNQAANAFFDEPAPAQNIVDLSTVTEDTTVEDGYTITGTLKGDYKISIAAGATVTLENVDITCLSSSATFAAITPLGNATIILKGNNTVMGPLINNYNAIFVPENTTLTIEGDGSLTASAGKAANEAYYHWATAIGAGNNQKAGNIVINSGNITAISGNYCAAIGGSQGYNGCGDITINGGTVTATCTGSSTPAIGSGAYSSPCGDITINGGTVTATGGRGNPAIGSGAYGCSCGNITISANVTSVTATKGSGASQSIGAGSNSTCGTVTIAPGANVTQN